MNELLEALNTIAKKETQTRYTGDAWEAGCDDGEILLARELLDNLETDILLRESNNKKLLQKAMNDAAATFARECPKCKKCFMVEGDEIQMMNAKHIQYKGVCYGCDGMTITHECSTIHCSDCYTTQNFPIAMGVNLDNITECLVCGNKNIHKTVVDEDRIIVTKTK